MAPLPSTLAIVSMGRDAACQRPASTPIPSAPHPSGFAEPRPSRLRPLHRRGHALTDRDRVDDVPGPASTSDATILPLPKNRDPVPAPAAAALPRIRAPCRSPPVRLRSSRSQPSGFATSPTPYVRKQCAATAGRGPDGCRRKHAFPGRSVAPGEGTASRFFRRGTMMARRRGIRGAQIHLIAIGKSRPGRKAAASDSRAPPGTLENGRPEMDIVRSIPCEKQQSPACTECDRWTVRRRGRAGCAGVPATRSTRGRRRYCTTPLRNLASPLST